ncbi:MAG: hypothetical protein OEZ65_02450 [Gemmatimonadota bacterium]|nr:hypothetical protein [Gemmatimonadota bacterium]MDH5758422.1 hypothetical protein [Gemmatimonadota bacterium]
MAHLRTSSDNEPDSHGDANVRITDVSEWESLPEARRARQATAR